MTRDNDKQPEDSDDDLNEFARDPFKRSGQAQAGPRDIEDGLREDFEDDFDDDPYDEPERDTAYPPAYREEDDEEDDDYYEDQPRVRSSAAQREAGAVAEIDDYLDEEDEDAYEAHENGDQAQRLQAPRATPAGSEQWLEEPAYGDDGDELDTDYNQRLPVALLVVAVVAVILLLAGGYGVMKDRAASQAEITRLSAELATAASGEELDEARAEAEALRAQNNELEDRLYDLQIENRKLSDLVDGLEAQVAAVSAAPAAQAGAAPAPAPSAEPAPAPTPAPAPAPDKPTPRPASSGTTGAGGDWFVNFGSYGQLSAAQAWQARLQPASGEVITAEGEREGRTFYRVRVVNLPDKATAEKVARALEAEYDLPRLWVGQR
jgi:cell division septation protein DedD